MGQAARAITHGVPKNNLETRQAWGKPPERLV